MGDNALMGSQRIASSMAENIIVGGKFAPGTPVDTNFARGSWYPALNGASVDSAPSGIRSADTVLANVARMTRTAKLGDSMEIWTNTEYMPSLEYGHSKQAPTGMVRLTLRSAQAIADDVTRGIAK